ncbi:unnamed protein product [Paramecium sonneborni]|uniref:Transmembrane protein n=1 Tax=Paramecium sonneborni TaxID=65129 RepID=A0A8S1Q903_9CILI|nr:unnamed protein product [Paramecium sonneborni]
MTSHEYLKCQGQKLQIKYIYFLMLLLTLQFLIYFCYCFNEEEQSILTNPIQEYHLIECEIDDQCNQCNQIQMNEIKQCQVSRQIQKMICYYQLGDDEQIKYPQVDYKACHKIGIFQREFLLVIIIFGITLFSWNIVSKEKDESEKQLLYKILK